MASDSKIATDDQGNPSLQATNTQSHEDDDENVDLGATSPSQTSLRGLKQDFEMINLDADEEDEDDFETNQHDKKRKRYRKKKKKREELNDSSSDDESNKLRTKNDEINPVSLSFNSVNYSKFTNLNEFEIYYV